MCPTTTASESPPGFYPGSDTDEPPHQSGYGSQKQLLDNKDLHPSHKVEIGQLVAEGDTATMQTGGPQPVGDLIDLDKVEAEDKTFEVFSGVHKRKRSPDDNGEAIISKKRTSGDAVLVSVPNGYVGTESSSRKPGGPEPSNFESILKRGIPEHTTSQVSQVELIGKVSPSVRGLTSSLPIQIWQHVFCFVPPVFLGRLLRVNRTFHSILNPDLCALPKPDSNYAGAASFQSAGTIWAASRRRFAPGLPKPLDGIHELNMWRLMRGDKCQICGEKSKLLTSSTTSNPWQSGPGSIGVRILWPFGVRCCGKCLNIHSEKEVTLLLSSTFPSFLLPALPFAFISQSDHYVASIALRNVAPPTDVQLTKRFYKVHVEKIKHQLDEARELGPATAEEWIKGLEAEGQERRNDAARWEQWEAKGGLKKVNSRPNPKTGSSLLRQVPINVSTTTAAPKALDRTNTQATTNINLTVPSASVRLLSPIYTTNVVTGSLPKRPPILVPQVRPERNIRDVNEAKAARRAEIERRCMALDPPLEANVLSHMESFQAALQISTMLTDNAWDMLRPRLLAQRGAAERHENERIQQTLILQVRSEERKYQDAQLKEAKELHDKEWDSVQAPIRHCLAVYADEIIQSRWAGGISVTKDTCATFAVDVLLYARRRFYHDIAQDDQAKRAAGELIRRDSPSGPPTRKLILENMKWLFDNKVKNFTEQFHKDLFLCNGCDGNFKLYGFEGVIQHYAAKHTTALSMGSVVVHWRAEWPEDPPFNPNPSTAKAAYYNLPASTPAPMKSQHAGPPQTTAAYGEYGQIVLSTPQPLGYGTQFSPGPHQVHYPPQLRNGHYQPPPILTQYPHSPGHDAQPSASQPGVQLLAVQPEYPVGLANGYPSYSQHQGDPTQHHFAPVLGHTYPQAMQQPVYADGYQPQYSGPTFPPSQSADLHLPHMPPYNPHTEATYPSIHVPGQDLYQTQMNEMAQQARDVWFATSGIKDIPQSVRIYVVIHHVVSRFEKKYTNEPSLSMFIDGLNHNALMRPVRSLNGLACKACVILGNSSADALSTHPQHLTTDRKLYTLPHLLNHFKSMHVERMRSTVDLQNDLKPTRLNWKHDMIELPETPLIADLINASGMDNFKLELVSTVFPGVFQNPLPSVGSVQTQGQGLRNGMGYNAGLPQRYHREAFIGMAQASSPETNVPPRKEEPALSRSESVLQSLSRPSTRASEPPGDDEYDPNRPAYYGKIVDSRQFAPNMHRLYDLPLSDIMPAKQPALTSEKSTHAKMRSHNASHEGKIVGGLFYGNQQRQSGDLYVFETDSGKDSPSEAVLKSGKIQKKSSKTGLDRYVSEDGEVAEEPLSFRRRNISRGADVTAAERFLNTFDPGEDRSKNDQAPERNDIDTGIRPSKRRTTDVPTLSPLNMVNRAVEVSPRRQQDPIVEHRMRSTPSSTDHAEARNNDHARYIQDSNGQPQSYDPQPRSVSRVRYPYQEEAYSDGRLSPRAHGPRVGSYAAHAPTNAAERLMSVPRNIHRPFQRSQDLPRRSRSRSPIQPARGKEQFRVRSPYPTSPQAAVYHISSPLAPRIGHSHRMIHYAYTSDQDKATHASLEDYPEEHYEQQVEYIPVQSEGYGYQEQSRYMISQPIEQRRLFDHTRPERSYVGEEVFERDGQLYYTTRHSTDPRPPRSSYPGYIEYRSEV
ncbi:hypothetical protein MMC13_005704 [Lambiella insularis]|nr:hypothetical protein [Lambiella insularis]